MARNNGIEVKLPELLSRIEGLSTALLAFKDQEAVFSTDDADMRKFIAVSAGLIEELQAARERLSPVRLGAIRITLGRSDSIAKFFAFSFTNIAKRPLDMLRESPFYGSGVYALYYHGTTEQAYQPLSGTETPIYVGKANPKNRQAETVEEQGQVLYSRLMEHSKNIEKTSLPLGDFHYRAAPIQTGMQSAVEDFMIRLFRPIWNKETRICFGIGKHGDSAITRANRRSPWDTIHPGREWAAQTKRDQLSRKEIEMKIAEHFNSHPVINDKDKLFKLLSLE